MSTTETVKKKISLPEYFKDGHILVVDDFPNMRKTVKNMLRQFGVSNVEEASDGDYAIKALKNSSETPCKFVLLDWNMPRMPGIFVTREIRADAELGDLPIIMITAEVDKEQIAQAGELGVSGYLIKPFVAKTLEEKILNVLTARENPPHHVKLLKAGEMLAKKGEYEKALTLFNEAMNLNAGARVMVHIGDVHELMGQFDKAIGVYTKAAERNPMFLKAHVKVADLHMKTGNDEAALAALEKANSISPSSPDRHMAVGKIHLKAGNQEKATESFNHLMKLAPEKAQDVAEELMKSGKPEMAEAVFRKTLETDSGNVHIYNRLGIALRRQGKWREAIEEYRKAIKVDPINEALYFNMAKAYMEGRDYQSAMENFNKVLRVNPDLEEAKTQIIELKKLMNA
ncbi:MAG: tetratricopeptide repeat protein [Nitrospinae bacterium]|nr:tetratricopeptide repeat protein [Nitrospinota bacterium]